LNSNNTKQDTIHELQRLLDIKDGSELHPNHPLTMTFCQIDDFHRQGNLELWKASCSKIMLLVKHLQEIEKYDSSLLLKFRNKLRKVQTSGYFGERVEINIASSFIRKGIKFIKSESPDFKKINEQDINFECSSVHLTQDIHNEKKLMEKLRKAILKKSKMGYAKPNTVLSLDATNIYHHDVINDFKFTYKENFRSFVKNVLRRSRYGSVIVFTYVFDPDNQVYYSNYIRIDNDNINNELRNFLNRHFPLGNIHLERHVFLKQG